jgi:solute carrier family 25 carnitine/acylcarnitine transporter 20/29
MAFKDPHDFETGLLATPLTREAAIMSTNLPPSPFPRYSPQQSRFTEVSLNRKDSARPPLFSPAIQNYLSGVIGGIAVTLVGHPFDTIKVRLQVQPGRSSMTEHTTNFRSAGSGQLYNGAIDCASKTVKGEGVWGGFYAGIGTPLVGQMVFRAFSFMSFYSVLGIIHPYPNPSAKKSSTKKEKPQAMPYHIQDRTQSLMLAGAITGALITTIETPIDLIKTKLQTLRIKQLLKLGDNVHHGCSYKAPYSNSVLSCCKFLIKKYGFFKGMYQGFGATLVRNVPANAMFFPVNELGKAWICEYRGYADESHLVISERLAAGATAGLCYWVGTCPLDCVKSLIMSTPQSVLRRELPHGRIWWGVVKKLYAEGGIPRFYKGVHVLAVRSFFACGIMFSSVDLIRESLGKL